MQAHIQKTFNVTCSRASLSRRIRAMGFTRGIIRRGFRSSDQSVPPLSPADIRRLMADPCPDEELVSLPGNAKKARYAWLLDADPESSRKPRRKKNAGQQGVPVQPGLGELPIEQSPEEQMVAGQYSIPVSQSLSPIAHEGYEPSYISPYRQVTAEGGMMIRHQGENSTAINSRQLMAGSSRAIGIVSGPMP